MTGRRRGQKSNAGHEVLHLCIDDHSRATDAEVLNEEIGETATAFANRTISWFAGHCVAVQRIMPDNGSPYKSRVFNELLGALRIRHIFTRPYTPRRTARPSAWFARCSTSGHISSDTPNRRIARLCYQNGSTGITASDRTARDTEIFPSQESGTTSVKLTPSSRSPQRSRARPASRARRRRCDRRERRR